MMSPRLPASFTNTPVRSKMMLPGVRQAFRFCCKALASQD